MTEEAEAEEAEQLRATQASHAERVNAYAAAFQRIRAATGIEDPHEVLEKFLNREGTAQSLADQREAYETRLEELQRQRSQLSREIEDTEVAAASVTGRDTVALDEERLAAEARVAALREKRAQTRSLLKDVKLGTAHVAGILGVHGGMSADGGGAVRDADLPAHVERCRRRVASLAQQVRSCLSASHIALQPPLSPRGPSPVAGAPPERPRTPLGGGIRTCEPYAGPRRRRAVPGRGAHCGHRGGGGGRGGGQVERGPSGRAVAPAPGPAAVHGVLLVARTVRGCCGRGVHSPLAPAP